MEWIARAGENLITSCFLSSLALLRRYGREGGRGAVGFFVPGID